MWGDTAEAGNQHPLDQHPGALPAVSVTTGARLPASLVRRWLCDSAVTRFVLSLGGRVIETSHTERTLKPHERRIKKVETGNRCQIAGCRCGPGRSGSSRLVPHHPDGYATTGTTSLADTVWICDRHHHDLHTGHKTLRLRDGRWTRTAGPTGLRREGDPGHTAAMREPGSYEVPLDQLERSARVPFDEQVLQEDVAVEAPEDEGVGHLPGGIRPYGV